MNLQISGKHIELTPAIKQYVEEKIGGLVRFNNRITDIRVTLDCIRQQHADSFRAAAQFHIGNKVLYTQEVASTMYAAIDIVKDEMERQLRDLKAKYAAKSRRGRADIRSKKTTSELKTT